MHLRLLLLSLATSALAAQVPLGQLAEVARARAERARPTQEKALEPFLPDLSLSYDSNYQFLDKRIEEAAALGDSVVPLLLEKLQPAQNSEAARNLADNCRRVLERLDPGSFVDALAELLQSRSETARRAAIALLGHALTNQAERLLLDLVDRTDGQDRLLVLGALQRHRSKAGAPKVVGLLGSNDRSLRTEVLDYLTAAEAGGVAETVVQALLAEQEDHLLPRYIEYFARSVREHDHAARALLGLLGERLDYRDTRQLVRALATVAPREHEPTVRRLEELLEAEKASELAVEAAVTLHRLGERQGVKRLKRTLDDQLRRPQRKQEASLYELRASLLFATDEFSDASDDYEKIIELSSGVAMTRRAYMGLIRCEANRKRWTQLVKAMKNSGMSSAELQAMGQGDGAVQTALQQEKARSFLRQLEKSEAPK